MAVGIMETGKGAASLEGPARPVGQDRFSTFWTGGDLCPISVMCLSSFLVRGARLDLYGYQDLPSAPAGAARRDASDVMPQDSVFQAHGGFEHFSDVFRYTLLHRVGGWWIDTDVVCNTDILPANPIAFARESGAGSIACGQIRFPAGHPVMAQAARRANDLRFGEWGAPGPRLLTDLIAEAKLDHLQWPTQSLYPICWAESAKYLLPEYCEEICARTRNAPFIHLYTSRFRRRLGFDQRSHMPPKGSFLERLYLRFGIGKAADRLVPVDEAALRRRIADFHREEWIRQVLTSEGLEFEMAEMRHGMDG